MGHVASGRCEARPTTGLTRLSPAHRVAQPTFVGMGPETPPRPNPPPPPQPPPNPHPPTSASNSSQPDPRTMCRGSSWKKRARLGPMSRRRFSRIPAAFSWVPEGLLGAAAAAPADALPFAVSCSCDCGAVGFVTTGAAGSGSASQGLEGACTHSGACIGSLTAQGTRERMESGRTRNAGRRQAGASGGAGATA